MTNKQIFELYEGLAKISEDNNLKFEVRATFNLAYDKNILEPLYKAIMETREKLFLKYSEPRDNQIFIPNEKVKDFTIEWDSFMSIDNTVSLKSISLQEFKEPISLDLMNKLLPIIEE